MSPLSGPVKLLCDEMLERLGRYLRAAGYDTEISMPGETDAALLGRAIDGGRLLLTCDREIADRRGARGRVLVLPANGLEASVRALSARVAIDWLRAPFSRCLIDNTLLAAAAAEDRARLPPRAGRSGSDVLVCPACGRLYWPGSHVRRMRARLGRWQRTTGPDETGARDGFAPGPGEGRR